MQHELLLGKTRSEVKRLSSQMEFRYVTRIIDDEEANAMFEAIDPEIKERTYKIWFKDGRVVAIS